MSEREKPKKELETISSVKTVSPTADEVQTTGAWLRQVANNHETSNSVRGECILLAQQMEATTAGSAGRMELMQRAAALARRASE